MSIDILKIFSKNLKNLRNAEKLTIPELSKNLNLIPGTYENYEFAGNIPPLTMLQKIASYFQVSIDFLLLWENTNYPHNIKLLSLAGQIDKLDQTHRFQMESNVNTFLKVKETETPEIKQDDFEFSLTGSINTNIELIRNNLGLKQSDIASKLNVTQSLIAQYERKIMPPVDKLAKLSEIFNVSIHALITGEKLYFKFEDNHIGKAIFKADQVLSLEEQKPLIQIMEMIVKSASK